MGVMPAQLKVQMRLYSVLSPQAQGAGEGAGTVGAARGCEDLGPRDGVVRRRFDREPPPERLTEL